MEIKDYLTDGKLLAHTTKEQTTSFTLKIAVAVLLTEMAHVNDEYAKEEFEQIIRILDREFQLMDEEADHLRRISEVLIADKSKVDEALVTIRSHFDLEQRAKIFEMVQAVAKADGTIDKYENFFSTYIRKELEL